MLYICIYIHENVETNVINVIVNLPHPQKGSGSSKSIFIYVYTDI